MESEFARFLWALVWPVVPDLLAEGTVALVQAVGKHTEVRSAAVLADGVPAELRLVVQPLRVRMFLKELLLLVRVFMRALCPVLASKPEKAGSRILSAVWLLLLRDDVVVHVDRVRVIVVHVVLYEVVRLV